MLRSLEENIGARLGNAGNPEEKGAYYYTQQFQFICISSMCN